MRRKNGIQLLQPFYRKYWMIFLFGIVLLIVVDLLQLLIPRLIGRCIDSFLVESDALHGYILQILIVSVVMVIGRYYYRQHLLGTTRRLEYYLRRKLFFHSLRLPMSFYDQNGPGKLMALMTNDITAVRMAFGLGSILFVDAVMMGLASFVVMVRMINWELSAWSILPLPIILLIATYMGRIVHGRFRTVQEKFSELTEFSQEIFAAAKVIKGFAAEEKIALRFQKVNKQNVAVNMSLVKLQAAYIPVTHILPFICYAVALYLGGKLIVEGQITVGDLTAFIGYQGLIIWPMMGLGFLINMAQRGLASLERISNFLTISVYEKDFIEKSSDQTGCPSNMSTAIVLKSLTFSYPLSHTSALKNINLTIQEGETIGLVGRTGSGKSTLLKLILRLYDAPEGSILIGGKEIHHIDFLTLRHLCGYVPQEQVLFSKTIGENIAFDGDYREEEIIEAARLAAVTEDIHTKPAGFDTELGEKGKKLSGGQQQRVAIARAFIKNPPILLLDDVFSALDYETEAQVLRNMRTFIHSRTTLIVSQRVAAVTQCDRIVVLDHGEICEQGSHTELVAKRGLYYEIYAQQLMDGES
jgi:ATP-binding cassette, subfamily B, multidrug efflux pump